MDLFGGFVSAGVVAATVFLFTLVLSGFFDAMGTITSVSDEAGLTRDGKVEGMGRILLVDGAGAIAGGVTGSAPNTVFLESAAGVGEGARTGLACVVTGGLFLVALLFTPLGGRRARTGRGAGTGGDRRADDDPDPPDPLAGHRLHDPGVPDRRDHPVHLLHHQRHRRRPRVVRGAQDLQGPLAAAG